jgi:hypothetical protein
MMLDKRKIVFFTVNRQKTIMENNASELRKFVEVSKAKPGRAGKVFKGVIGIATATHNVANVSTEIVIELLGYDGPFLKILNAEIDEQLFPTKFFTNKGSFVVMDNGHLKITGKDNINKSIGNYTADIVIDTPINH